MGSKILAFGEVLWDFIDGVPCIGGAPLNFCGHCAQMGDETYIISSVGVDDLGDNARTILKSIGVSDKYVSKVGFPTGTVPVSLVEGIPNYEIKTGAAWDHISVSDEHLDEILSTKWDVFYLGTLAQRSGDNKIILDRLFDKGLKVEKVFFDINLRQDYYTEEIIVKSFERANILKINDEELFTIQRMINSGLTEADDFARFLMEMFDVELLCITYGKKGAVLYSGREIFTLLPEKAEVVSTVGAGDSFSAGFIHGLISTGSITVAGELALKIAGAVVSRPGALLDYSNYFFSREGINLSEAIDRIKSL